MCRYKLYFKDGTSKVLNSKSNTPKGLVFDLDGLIDWDLYDKLDEKTMTTKEVLKLAFTGYKFYYKDYYRMEIINDETNETIDYIEESEMKQLF